MRPLIRIPTTRPGRHDRLVLAACDTAIALMSTATSMLERTASAMRKAASTVERAELDLCVLSSATRRRVRARRDHPAGRR